MNRTVVPANKPLLLFWRDYTEKEFSLFLKRMQGSDMFILTMTFLVFLPLYITLQKLIL